MLDLDAPVDLDSASYGLDGEVIVTPSAEYQNTDAGRNPPPPPSSRPPTPPDKRLVDDALLILLL